MKKFFALLLLCLLAIVPLLTMTACNGDTPENPAESITVIADGVSQYRIVRSDFANGTVKSVATELRNALGLVTGVKPDLVADYTDENDNGTIKEILIGKTNRPESQALLERLSGKEYGYEISGNKIVIVGATDALLQTAVAEFLLEYAGYTSEQEYSTYAVLSIPADLSVVKSKDRSSDVALYTVKDDVTYLDALYKKLGSVASSVTLKTAGDTPSSVFDVEEYGLVVVAGADTLPYSAKKAINAYMEAGGRILFLGGPTFQNFTYEWNGMPLSSGEYADLILDTLGEDDYSILLDTSKDSCIKKLSRSADLTSSPYQIAVGDYGLRGSRAQLYHEVNDIGVWDVISFSASADTTGNNCFAVCAKPANANTECFSIELKEKDGTRWFTNLVFESDDWQNYLFFASDFTLYQGTDSGDNGPDFDNVSVVQLGFSVTYGAVNSGKLAYCISSPMLCRADSSLMIADYTLTLDTIAPLYEQYPITNAAAIVTEDDQIILSERNYIIPDELFSCHPGRQGAGMDKRATSRFIPLLRVTDEKGLHSGYAAWIELFSSAESKANSAMEGSMVGCFSAASDDFYNGDGLSAVAEAVAAMTRNVFIVDGGTTEYLYVEKETDSVTVGVNYVALNNSPVDGMTLKLELYRNDKVVYSAELNAADGQSSTNNIRAFRQTYDLSDGKPDRAVVTLLSNGTAIDLVAHDITFWSPKELADRSYVYIEDGYFKKDGQILNLFGVNYLPSYNSASYVNEYGSYSYYNNYCANAAYDPEVISYDLAHIKDLGFNAISFSCNGVTNNLLDLIVQCEQAGLYIDLSINGHGTYPLMDFDADKAISTFEQCYLAHFDCIVAYDIAWEHRIGSYNGSSSAAGNNPGRYVGRQDWDDEWTRWVKTQYGSIVQAKEAWGCDLQFTDANDLLVTDEMLDDTSGQYQKMVAAYYRFLDDQISLEMLKLDAIKAAAPNQIFSFRMSMSGSAKRSNSLMPSTHCFDFQSLATSMAFMEPEGYALGSNDEACLQVMFANAYARYTQPDSPVVWKEFGKSVWGGGEEFNFLTASHNQDYAALYYQYVLDYCYTSYTSGMYCWFYAGGYRIAEESDYGILNPDGSDRPLTALLREYASKFIEQDELTDVVYIEVERDDYVGGLFGMYEAVKDELAAAYAAGKSVTFIDKSQNADGSYAYADTLLDEYVADAVSASGTAPLRYVNGMIKSFTTVKEGGKTYAVVTICNTKQSIWRENTVSIVSTDASDVALRYTIDEQVDYLEHVTVKFEISGRGDVDLRFEINGVQFGALHSYNIP